MMSDTEEQELWQEYLRRCDEDAKFDEYIDFATFIEMCSEYKHRMGLEYKHRTGLEYKH